MNEQQEREAFEAEMREQQGSIDMSRNEVSGAYKNQYIACAWAGWQARAALSANVPADPCFVLWEAMQKAGKFGNCTDDKLIVKFLREAGYCIATIAPEATRSQRLAEAGYTRRKSWKSLPKDGDDEANPACTCPSGDGSLRWPCPEHPAPAPEAACHYLAGPVKCFDCAHEWVAVRPAGADALECPACSSRNTGSEPLFTAEEVHAYCKRVREEERAELLAAPAPEADALEKAHEARRQAQSEAAYLKARLSGARLILMRELKEQGWTPPAPAQAQQSLTHELQQQCSDWGVYWRAPDAHGVDLSMEQAEELLCRALLVEVAIAQAKPEAQQPLTWARFVAACEAEYGEDFAPEEFMGASDDEKTEIMRVARMVERICAEAWGVKLAGIGTSGEASK